MTKMTESSVNRRLSDEGLTLKTPALLSSYGVTLTLINSFDVFQYKARLYSKEIFPCLFVIPLNIFTFQTAH